MPLKKVSKSQFLNLKNEDMMNMSDDDATDQFDEQVQELLAQTLEGEDQLEELFEQRTKEKAQGSKRQKSSARKYKNNYCEI